METQQTFNWYPYIRDIVLVLATTFAGIFAWYKYNKQRREEEAAVIRQILMRFQNNCKRMNSLMSYDVVHEIVASIVYSELMERSINRLNNFVSDGKVKIDKDFEWPWMITTPIQSILNDEYERLLRENEHICSELSDKFPSLHRIYVSVNCLFDSILEQTKSFARTEEVFAQMYIRYYQYKGDCDYIKDNFFYDISSYILHTLRDQQKNIDDSIRLLNLVNTAFLKLNPKKLRKQKKREGKLPWREYGSKETLFDEFQESEIGLVKVLKNDELLKFRELYVRIKVRQEEV